MSEDRWARTFLESTRPAPGPFVGHQLTPQIPLKATVIEMLRANPTFRSRSEVLSGDPAQPYLQKGLLRQRKHEKAVSLLVLGIIRTIRHTASNHG